MTQRAFHPDAMAVLSWAADPSGHIEFLSPSFRRMLRAVSSRPGSTALWKYSEGNLHACNPSSDSQVTDIWRFLEVLFTHPDSGTAQGFGIERPIDPAPWIKAVRTHLKKLDSDGGHERFDLVTVYREPMTRMGEMERHDAGSVPGDIDFETVSARVMHPHGLRIGGGGINDIYDLVFVRRIGPGRDGLQGLLQPAWERVYPVVRANVRTASLRLISRSLSHNIGSHALMYLQKELETGRVGQQDTPEDFNRKLAKMARYLRERFEMMASVSVESPLAWGRDTIRRLVEEFHDNQLLRERICRSEGVDQVIVPNPPYGPDPLDIEVGLPGELIARHAFMLMLENVVRDCAKHQRAPGGAKPPKVTVHIAVDPSAGGPGLVHVELWASRDPSPGAGGDELGRSAGRLNKLLNEGIICDHEGIPPREWGTLERLMCAAYLRGHRPEDLLPTGDEPAGHARDVLGIASPNLDFPLLSVRHEPSDQTLRWVFYLPTPRAPLAVVPPGQGRIAGMAFELLEWDDRTGAKALLGRLPDGCSEILLVASDNDHAERLDKFVKANRHRIPGLVHVTRGADVPKDRAAMLKSWIDRRRPDLKVRICDNNVEFREAARSFPEFLDWAKAENEVDDDALTEAFDRPNLFVILCHPSAHPRAIRKILERRPAGPGPALDVDFLDIGSWPRLEAHVGEDRLRALLACSASPERFLEIARAGAMRVLVADERIGESGGASDRPGFSDSADLCTVRERWAMAGVDIMRIGKSADDRNILEKLRERIKSVDGGYDYAFIHLGILEKCARALGGSEAPAKRLWSLIGELSKSPGAGGEPLRLIIHSGRTILSPPTGSDEPDFRFCPLGNVERILLGTVKGCKLDVIRMADALWLPSKGSS